MKVLVQRKGLAVTLLAGALMFSTIFDNSAFALAIDKEDFEYDISGGEISSIEADEPFSSLIIKLDAESNGELGIDIPRSFMDAKLGTQDDHFFVLVDGEEIIPEETKDSQKRTLSIPFDKGSGEIEIIGTSLNVSALDMPAEPTPPPQEIAEEIGDGGGCLIATATYGTELAETVQSLRETREAVLQTQAGSAFMAGFNLVYYSFSPQIADLERQNPVFKEMVKAYLTPMLASLSVLDLAQIDSEQDVLFFGSLVIAINLGMYVAAPTLTIAAVRKHSRSRR